MMIVLLFIVDVGLVRIGPPEVVAMGGCAGLSLPRKIAHTHHNITMPGVDSQVQHLLLGLLFCAVRCTCIYIYTYISKLIYIYTEYIYI